MERRLRKYTAPSLLILDEIGYLPCSRQAADLLYTIISRRHENRSLILSTNLAFKQWNTVFPGAACVAALIDRFVQHCHVVDRGHFAADRRVISLRAFAVRILRISRGVYTPGRGSWSVISTCR